MPQFYHVNHGCEDYTEGHVITLRPFIALTFGDVATWQAMERIWNQRFPAGFSLWGLRLLYNDFDERDIPDRELDCEKYREKFFPTRPSRFQSLFGLGTLPEALEFKRKMKKPAAVWVVETAEVTFRGDMNHLRYGKHPTEVLQAYWEGKPAGPDPIWEHLLVPPVRLVRRIDDAETISATTNS